MGRALRDFVLDAIELMRPSSPEQLSEPAWRHYILLNDYIARGQPWGVVAARLGLARTAFYNVRKDATGSLAMVIDSLEAEARRELPRVRHNLPHPPYQYFIRRFVNEEDLVDRIIGELGGRAWVIAIYGAGGVGKTAVAYELPLLARSYLESIRRRDSFLEIKGKSIAEFLGEAYDNLAQYYASHLGEMKSLSEKLAFLKYDKRNVTSVMEWCYSNKQLDHVIALMHQIGHPLDILGYWDERIEWGMKARQAASELDRPPESAWFEVYDIGWTYFLMGRMEEAKKITESIYDLAQGKDGFERVEALAIGNLGRMAHEARDYKLALDKLEKSLALWQEIGDREWIAYAKARLGRLKEKTGALDEAREILKQTLKLRSEIGHVGEVAETLSELALVEFGLGDEEEALGLSDSSLIRARLEIEHPSPFYAFALYCRAVLEGRRGNPLEARKRGQEALTLYKNLGYKYMVNHVSSFLERLESKGPLPSGN